MLSLHTGESTSESSDDRSTRRRVLEYLNEHRAVVYVVAFIIGLFVLGALIGQLNPPSNPGARAPPLLNVVGGLMWAFASVSAFVLVLLILANAAFAYITKR